MFFTRRRMIPVGLVCISLLITACGGSGKSDDPPPRLVTGSSSSSSSSSSSNSSNASVTDINVWQPGVFHGEENFADSCVNPREGTDPVTGSAFRDRPGTFVDENNFLRSVSHDLYLWYQEITDRNPASYNDVEHYFQLLKTTERTVNGTLKDQFHWSESTEVLNASTDQGLATGYGITWIGSEAGEIIVATVEPFSVADKAGITRGMRLQSVNGFNLNALNNEEVALVNRALYPYEEGETYQFGFLDPQDNPVHFTLSSAVTDIYAVHKLMTYTLTNQSIGYMVFNTHSAFAEYELREAIQALKDENISDLILDLRYNGGGYLDIASQLAYMIGGHHVQGKVFENMIFNDKHPVFNPVTGEHLVPVGFHEKTLGFSPLSPAGQSLPTLNLAKVTFITGSNTCSASEAIINGLAGADIDITLIGATTCGKPYGAYIIENCGTSYFTTQFSGENHKGFGDFSDGFKPTSAAHKPTPAHIKGCMVADDYGHELGKLSEARLNAALFYNQNGRCPANALASQGNLGRAHIPDYDAEVRDGVIRKAPGTNDKLLRNFP